MVSYQDPKNQEAVIDRDNHGEIYKQIEVGGNRGILKVNDKIELANKAGTDIQGITMIENKKGEQLMAGSTRRVGLHL